MLKQCKDLISIVVAVYNVEAYIEKCINSLLAQTYTKLEIILVDDGSTDNSGEICDIYSKKSKMIKVIHKKNGGLSSARNAGIRIAKGTLIGFVDGDDTLNNMMYEKLYQNLISTNSDISICGRYYVFNDSKKYIRYKKRFNLCVMNSEEAIKEMNNFSSFDMAAWDKLYKTSLFDSIRFPEGKLSEDYFIMYKLFLEANKICYTPEPLYNYMQRKNSISHSTKINFDFIEASKQQMLAVEKIYPRLKHNLHTAYASANMTVYDFYLKAHVNCPLNQQKELQENVRKNLIFVKKNDTLSSIKKVQAYLFVYSISTYNLLFKLFRKLNKV